MSIEKNFTPKPMSAVLSWWKGTLPLLQASPPCWQQAGPQSHSAGWSQQPGSYGGSIRGMNQWCSGSVISHREGEVNAELWICSIINRTFIRRTMEQWLIRCNINMEISHLIDLAIEGIRCRFLVRHWDQNILFFPSVKILSCCHTHRTKVLAVLAVVNFLIERINMVTYCSDLTVEMRFVQRGLGVILSQIKPNKAKAACQVASRLCVCLWANLRNKTLTSTNFNKPLFLFRSWSGWSVSASATAAPSPVSSRTCRLICHCHAKQKQLNTTKCI